MSYPGAGHNPPPQATFDAYAKDYDRALRRGIAVSGEEKEYFAKGRVAQTRIVLEALGVEPRSVLDFGCGTGSTAPVILETWPRCSLVGIDTSAESIREARETHSTGRVRFELIDDYTPACEHDLVYCNGVFHHIPPAERAAALDYIRRSLTPGGVLAFCENNPWNPGARLVMHRIPFDRDAIPLSPREARRLLRAAAFEILRTDGLFVFPRPLAWFRRLEPALVRFPIGAQYIVFCRKPAVR
ncbi:MAG: methyltransferase [Gemmatimonadaceae bacterium]